MRIRPFEYLAPESLEEALTELRNFGSDTVLLAGGTDLILAMKHKSVLPTRVMGLQKVRELNFIRQKNSTVHIGALATHSWLCAHDVILKKLPMLGEAVSMIGSWQIRNIATLGGNLCNASPAADSAPPLLALDSRVVLADSDGEQEAPLSSFFLGPGQTALTPSQILKEVIIEIPSNPYSGCYLKMTRKRGIDLAVVGVAFHAEIDPSTQTLAKVAIALGGVAPTPMRATEAEKILAGLSSEEALRALADAAQAAVAATTPIDDIRATAEYRKAIVEVYVRQAGAKVINSLVKAGGNRN